MSTWSIGNVKITAVLESETALSPEFVMGSVLPQAQPDALRAFFWLAPHYVDEQWRPLMVTQALVVESAGRRILVDTCIGNEKPRQNPAFRLHTAFLERLAAVGCAPECVDFVVCTHLHFDHVGWNTRWTGAAWVPTFPSARYIIAREEWKRYADPDASHPQHIADSVVPIVEAGLVDWVEPPHALTPEVQLQPTPGHTPGHVSIHITSGGAHAWITGDMLHHPCQFARPDWTSLADSDPARARDTRERFILAAQQAGALVVGTHFPPPAAGRVGGGQGRWCFVPEEPAG